MQRVTKEQIKALKKVLGSTDIKVPMGDGMTRVNIGALADIALRQVNKEKPAERRFRYVNAGEMTVWQRQTCLESGLASNGGKALLVWIPEADVIDLGVEVKKEGKSK